MAHRPDANQRLVRILLTRGLLLVGLVGVFLAIYQGGASRTIACSIGRDYVLNVRMIAIMAVFSATCAIAWINDGSNPNRVQRLKRMELIAW